MVESRVFSFNEMPRHLFVPVTDDNMFYVVDLLMAIKDESRSFISNKIITQKWVEKSLSSGMIIERQIGAAAKIKLVSFDNAIEFIKLVPPVEQRQTKLKFIEMIRRYLGGDHSLLKEDYAPDDNSGPVAVGCGVIQKRKRGESKEVDAKISLLQTMHDVREADLAFVISAANGLKDICGGQLDDDAKEALKTKMFKLLERE